MTSNDIFNTLLTPTEVLEYTCTAINSLREVEEYRNIGLNKTSDIGIIQDFIINTLIANELSEGWRDKVTGRLL